jgi:hypothetical protein
MTLTKYKITFKNCQTVYVETLQGEKEAIRTAIKQSCAHLKVYKQIDLSFNEQRKNIIHCSLN